MKLFQSAINDYAAKDIERKAGHFLWVIVVQTAGIEQVAMVAECLYKDRPCEYLPACYR